MADSYKLIVGYNTKQFEQGDYTPNEWKAFDVVRSRNVNMSSNMASQPMQSGDTATDHMYRNPVNYRVTGVFSMNGSRAKNEKYRFNENKRLQDIQDFFENINRNGYLCTLRLVEDSEEEDDGSGISFKVRNHMALKSVSWTEYVNHMEFDMEFSEIIVVDKQVYNSVDDVVKELYPNVLSVKTISLHDYYMNDDGDLIFSQLVKVLVDNGYIDAEFLKRAESDPNSPLSKATQQKIAISDTVAYGSAGAAAGVGLAVLAGSSAAAGPIGWVVGGVALLVCIGTIAYSSKKKNEQEAELAKKDKYKIKLVNNSTAAGNEKLNELKNAVKTAVAQLNLDCKIYSIDSSDNQDSQIMIMIGGKFYIMSFTYNNGTNKPGISVIDFVTGQQPAEISNTNAPLVVSTENMTADDGGDKWFSYNGYDVYLVNTAIGLAGNDDKKSAEAYKKLSNYSIWVSNGPIKDKLSGVTNALMDVLKNKGYEV